VPELPVKLTVSASAVVSVPLVVVRVPVDDRVAVAYAAPIFEKVPAPDDPVNVLLGKASWLIDVAAIVSKFDTFAPG
jgi:hypothetical protein